MALETGTYISDLVSTNPVATDGLSESDNHLVSYQVHSASHVPQRNKCNQQHTYRIKHCRRRYSCHIYNTGQTQTAL